MPHDHPLSRRQFARISAAAAAASATGAASAATTDSWTVVDEFDRPDSFYHGHGWESLNPGYWKLLGKSLRRRVKTRGDRARKTGFPFHKFMETDYETRPPYGMIWRRDWKLTGNFQLRMEATVHSNPGGPEPSYSLLGICFGGRTLYESWNGTGEPGDACWYAAWRDDGSFGLYDHTTDDANPVAEGSVSKTRAPKPGDNVTIEVRVTGGDSTAGSGSGAANVEATLEAGDARATVTVSGVERQKFLDGFFGLAARGSLDFGVNSVSIVPEANEPIDAPVNELQVCYPLGDSLRKVGDRWRCRFIAIFRQEGRRGEIRIATSENPEGGWDSVPIAGRAPIDQGGESADRTNDFRRATAVIDCDLPADPSETTLYYTVRKDGVDVTADPRPGARQYVGRLPQLTAPYKLCGLSCHAISGHKPGMDRTQPYQENWIHYQPLPDSYDHLEDYGFQVMVWEDDIWYLELVLYTTSTDDAYKIITTTIANPVTRWQMMRHWNVLNPGDHDYGMDDVKGPEQIAIRTQAGLGQDIEYMQRNFQIVQHLILGDENPSGTANPKRWRRWKMPKGDFSLLIVDARLWRTSQDTHIWENEGWTGKGHIYDRKDPTRSLLGEEQFAWLEETIKTDSSRLICLTGLNGLHTVWQPSAEAEQRNRISADYAGWVKAGTDRAIDVLSSREGVVSIYGDVHIGSIFRNRQARLYECSFGPIGRTGGRGLKDGFGRLMTDYDGRKLDGIALFHQDYESPDLDKQTTAGYWNFLEAEFDPRPREPRIGLRVRRLNDPPSREPRGGGSVDVGAWETGRIVSCRLPEIKTLPNADVRFASRRGRPIRATRSLADGTVVLPGLVDVAPGAELILIADDGTRVDAQRVKTVPLA